MTSDPTGRVLRLLSLLQAHRQWSGHELAERLGVTSRTLRRDVDRLRHLGYPVDSVPGVGGGYRLAAGTHLPPLLLDDDEAVAIAVGLRVAARATISGMEETSVRAMAKLEQVLPDRLRRRVSSVHGAVAMSRWSTAVDEMAAADDLAVLAQACRDNEEARFEYRRRDGEESSRLVRPHQLVVTGRRWYLVAWDVRRADWRTFRLDRITDARLAGARFEPMELPAEDAAAFVAASLSAAPRAYTGIVVARTGSDDAESALRWADSTVAALDDHTCRIEMRGDSLDQLTATVGQLAMTCGVEVLEPPELVAAVAGLAARLSGR